MKAICDAFPGCAITAMASEGDSASRQFEYAGASADEIDFVQEKLETENDVQRVGYAQFLALPPGFVVRSRKYMGDETFHATTLYRNVPKPMGFGHCMQMMLGAKEERFIDLFMSFRETAPDRERLYDALFRLLTLRASHPARRGDRACAAHVVRGVAAARRLARHDHPAHGRDRRRRRADPRQRRRPADRGPRRHPGARRRWPRHPSGPRGDAPLPGPPGRERRHGAPRRPAGPRGATTFSPSW